MTGTFGGALEARGIPAGNGRLTSHSVGEIEKDDGVLIIKRIHVTYRLDVDEAADREAIARAMQFHPTRCPVYRSLHPQIAITTALELTESPG